MKLTFCLQTNRKAFYKMIVLLWVCVARHVQSTEINKFTISLQNLKKDVRDEVVFLDADKHQIFLQVDSNTLDRKVSQRVILLLLIGIIKHSRCTQSTMFAIFLQYLLKSLEWSSFFCIQINIKISASWIIVFD